jgi:predicted RNase H-like HicB family nuclease
MLKTKVRFLIALRKDPNSDWGAEVVGEPIFSVGSTMEEAIENLKEAIQLHYEGEEINYEIPVEALKSGEYDDAILKVIEVNL